MDFDNDELSLLYVAVLAYTNSVKAEIAETPKSKPSRNRLVVLRNQAVALNAKIADYLKTQGISFE